MIKPILSIIVVSYNTCDITLNCLKSIFSDKGLTFDLTKIDKSDKIPAEIIIVDNNSQDDTLKSIKKLSKPISIIQNQQNIGFGQANNQGIQKASGNYILLLNSDTIILHSAISQSLIWLSAHPGSYGCTAQLLNKNGTIQASGGYFPNLLNTFTWCIGLDDLPLINKIIKPFHPHTPDFYTHDRYYLSDHPQDWITGAYMLLRKNVIDKTGGFDKDYFMYSEEVDLCYRIKKFFSHLNLWYLIGPQIIHLGSASSSGNLQFSYQREYEGVLSFFKKHRPKYQYEIASGLIKINQLLRRTVYKIFKNV